MKTVYDTVTQSSIDFIQNRMAEIVLEMETQLRDARSISIMRKIENPHYNPLDENIEYQCLRKNLERIYQLAVPKHILTLDEYEWLIRIKGGDA